MTCTFCTRAGNDFQIVYEDDKFVAFHDKFPAARIHYLVIPKKHIPTVNNFSRKDIETVREMKQIGNNLLEKENIQDHERQIGFHVPPL